jgi:membrane protein CcdC involved in cytochrome C biogenesis
MPDILVRGRFALKFATPTRALHKRDRIMALHFSPGVSIAVSLAGLAAVLVWRVREGRTAVTLRKILIPPVGMATGFAMFIEPAFRVPIIWAIAAFLIGAVALAYPLLLTSRLERVGDAIMMKRSGVFFAVVIVLAVIRYLARGYLDSMLSIPQTGGLFFILAFGMILRWRMSMFFEYRALTA